MSREHRYDVGTLRPPKRMGDGRLRVDAHLTRSGVFTYVLPSGKTQKEYRPDTEVFRKDSLDTLSAVVVTDDHPSLPVTSHNARDVQMGMVGETVRKDGTHVAAALYVTDARLIEKMESGKRDVSCGYTCDLDRTPGISPDGEHYDAVQRNIEYNHVAIVSVGRAGSARVRMDAARQVIEDQQERNMADKDNDKEALLTAASKLAVAEQKLAEASTRADAAEGRVSALETEVAALRAQRTDANVIAEKDAEIKKQTTRADEAERALAGVPERLRAGVKARVLLEKAAMEVLGDLDKNGKATKVDDLSDREIMVLVVEKLHGVQIEANRTDDYARARFDAAVESYRAGSATLARLRDVGPEIEKDKKRHDVAGAREEHINNIRDAWKKPLPSTKKGA